MIEANIIAITLSVTAIAFSFVVFRRTQDAERIRAVDESSDGGYYQHRSFLDGRHVEIDGEMETSLRIAKKKAFALRMQLEQDLGADEASAEWMLLSGYEAADQPWNTIAYNLAEVLTLIGTRCTIGSASLGATLIHVGDAIVDDWIICREWVESYRDEQNIWTSTPFGRVPWHRREGESLALVAALYLDKRWDYSPAQMVVRDGGGRWGIVSRVVALSDPDRAMYSHGAIQDISKIASRRLAWMLRLARWTPTRWLVIRLVR